PKKHMRARGRERARPFPTKLCAISLQVVIHIQLTPNRPLLRGDQKNGSSFCESNPLGAFFGCWGGLKGSEFGECQYKVYQIHCSGKAGEQVTKGASKLRDSCFGRG